jgi:TPR repeat protein
MADEGLLDDPPQIVEDYGAAMKRGDKAAANILLNKMTPWEQERAAEIQHDYSLTAHVLTEMANQDDVKAQRRLAQLYSWTTDFDMAALAKYQASIHQISTAPPRNDELAFKYARLASQNGDEKAQEILAKAYACGRGTEKNFVNAYVWFSLSLSQSAHTLETDEQPEVILRKRAYLAGEMTHADVQSAKHLLMRCYKSHYKDCD